MSSYAWNHTEKDQYESMCFQMRRIVRSPFQRKTQARTLTTMLIVAACPVLVITLICWDEQDAVSIGGGALIFLLLFYFIVLKKPSEQALDKAADKQANRYMNSLDIVPTGLHRVLLEEGRFQWEWIEEGLVTSFPSASFVDISEAGGLLHLARPNNAVFSIPLDAFGTDANRRAFIDELRTGPA